MRIAIVEDHELLAHSLSYALHAEGFDVALCFGSSLEAISEQVIAAKVDLVLLDLHLGDRVGSGLPLIATLRASGAHVVVLTGVTDRARLGECVEAGAEGIVTKDQAFGELVRAVTDAATRGRSMSDEQRTALLQELRHQRREEREHQALFGRLTPREQHVLAELVDGKAAERIATDSFVSLSTVRSQIRSVLAKLGLNSQLEAVALVRRAGWRPPA